MKCDCLKIRFVLPMAILLSLIPAYAQREDFFPSFDMMSMMRISHKCPLRMDTSETLRLVNFYGKSVGHLIDKLGSPEYTTATLYFGKDPYSGFPEIHSILDAYREMEIPVKIYEWPESSIYVYCVGNGDRFLYPCGLSRYNCSSASEYRLKAVMLPLEKWLAADSGDDDWFVVAWSDSPDEGIERLEHFEYRSHCLKHDSELEFHDPTFMMKFTVDDFSDFYFRTFTFGDYVGVNDRRKPLAEYAGMKYDEFVKIVGHPKMEQTTVDGEVSAEFMLKLNSSQNELDERWCQPSSESLHLTWPLKKLISNRKNHVVKVCAYAKEYDYEHLFAYFVRDGRHWKLIYADIAPEEFAIVEF